MWNDWIDAEAIPLDTCASRGKSVTSTFLTFLRFNDFSTLSDTSIHPLDLPLALISQEKRLKSG